MSSVESQPEHASYTMGPLLAAETPTPPFTPRAAGRIAFFFGPLAGALVTAINLRRMRLPDKARTVTTYSLLAALIAAPVLIFTPEPFGRIVGLGLEALFYAAFKNIQAQDFEEWQAANPEVVPTSGWRAIGWGIAGMILFFLIVFLVAFVLYLFGVPFE